MRFYYLLLFVFFMCLSGQTVFASDTYHVANIAVDVEGENAIKARENALKEARRNAYNTLEKRLIGAQEHSYKPSDDVIASMVDSFTINREKSSRNRYMASVDVAFNERAVAAYWGRLSPSQRDNATSYEVMDAQNIDDSALSLDFLNQNATHRSGNAIATQTYSIQANISGVRHWVSLQKAFQSVPNVAGTSLRSLSSSKAVLDVQYAGNVEDFHLALARKGWRLLVNQARHSPDAAAYILLTQG
jgi:hypothetical protein